MAVEYSKGPSAIRPELATPRNGAANQGGRQNASSSEATHQKPGERRSEHAAQGEQSDGNRRSRALDSCSLEQIWCPGPAGRQHHKGDEIAGPQQKGSASPASGEKLPHRYAPGLFAVDDKLTVGGNVNSRANLDQQIPNLPPGCPAHNQEFDRIGQCANQNYRQTERQNAADVEQRLPTNRIDQPRCEESGHHPTERNAGPQKPNHRLSV